MDQFTVEFYETAAGERPAKNFWIHWTSKCAENLS